ncbi:MAG: hypothetical protein ACREI7_11835, partial [Myxococcota bacterium]
PPTVADALGRQARLPWGLAVPGFLASVVAYAAGLMLRLDPSRRAAAIAGAALARRVRQRALEPRVPSEPPAGIADVDPEPLMGIVEAIDPDAVTGAHRSVREQRERLPL